jgi:non-ribosomal peptide synthetase component F
MRMMDHFKELLVSIVKNPQQKIGELQMLTKAEEPQLLVEFNDTAVDYPKDKTIVDLFEEQAAKTPGAIAIVFEEEQLSYRQLNERANQLAYYLRSRGVKEETLVPICIERSLAMIIGILGILKAGGAYVPIDPEYPEERISYMLEDTAASIIISSKQSRSKLQSSESIEIIELDTEWSTGNSQLPTTNSQLSTLRPHHLAYVIYTSGSTGKPKGVKMANRGLVNLLSWQEKQFQNKSRQVLQFASLNFDVSFQEIFSTLCFGSALHLIKEENRRDTPKMIKDLGDHRITHLFVPYIVLKNLAEYIVSHSHNSFSLQEIIDDKFFIESYFRHYIAYQLIIASAILLYQYYTLAYTFTLLQNILYLSKLNSVTSYFHLVIHSSEVFYITIS